MDLKNIHLHWRNSSYKGKTYHSYSLARPYRKNGKNLKEIVLKLGKLSDQEVRQWRGLLEAIKKPDFFLTTLDDLWTTDHYSYLDVAAVNEIWDEWELDTVFNTNGKRTLDIAKVARILTLNRCLDPAAKSLVPEWFQGTALPWMLDVNPAHLNSSRIFRELKSIESNKEALCAHLFHMMQRKYPHAMKSVFYDLSSSKLTGSRCILAKWGHCKSGYHTHVVIAIVVNDMGLPFYWEVLPGGTADATTIIWLLDCLKHRFKVPGTTLVFDRGMVSDENLKCIEGSQIKYISAMDKSQIEGITGIDFTQFSHLDPTCIHVQADQLRSFTKIDESTYYREIKVEGKRRYILCFNPQLFKDQCNARTQAVENFHAFVKDTNSQLLEAKKSRQREPTYNKFKQQLKKAKIDGFVDVTLRVTHVKPLSDDGNKSKIRTYQATVVVNENDMRIAGRLDGFWLLVTNHANKVKETDTFELPATEAIAPYREKTIIESAFRDIKSFVEIEPVYVWNEVHVKAHYSICVMAYLINKTLSLRLHKYKGNTTKDVISHMKLYHKLSGGTIDRIEVENMNLVTYALTKPSKEQKELLNRLGFSKLIQRKHIDKIKLNISKYI